MTSATAAHNPPAPHSMQMLARHHTMETTGRPPVFATPVHHAASPPVTPESSDHTAVPRSRIAQGPGKRPELFAGFQFSPQSDSRVPQEGYARAATPELLNVPRNLSRPSTSSGLEDSPHRGRSTPDVDARSEVSNARSSVFCWLSEEHEILIEELTEDDPRFLRTSDLLRPDKISEAGSERAASPSNRVDDDIVRRIEELYCDKEERSEARRKWNARRNRYRTRSKRTWSESHGSDFDAETTASVDLDGPGTGVHRDKRRKSVLAQRSSLIFDDPPRYNIAEVDEPDDETVLIDAPPPYPEIDWSDLGLWRSLPFGILPDSDSDCSSEEGEEAD